MRYIYIRTINTTIMNWKINNLFNAFTAGLLSLLGFSSCSNNNNDEPCLYGSPISEYHFKGTVTDEQGAPIKGIKVVVKREDALQAYRMDSTYTDSNGNYQTADRGTVDASYDVSKGKLYVNFEDVDGNENGGYFGTAKAAISEIDVKQTDKGDGMWDKGKFELTVNKKLLKKNNQ